MDTSSTTVLLPYNKVVAKAHQHIYRKAKQMLATIDQHELRYSLERESKAMLPETVVHEFINPLLYLRLDTDKAGLLCIHYGFEEVIGHEQYSNITAAFVRCIYYSTSKEQTAINIEAAVKTNWLIRTCSEMYEYVEDRNRHHTFKQIPYKVKPVKRKLQAVA